jgi:uncharacterized protein (DUF3820 family)
MVMPFGCHKGREISKLPNHYLLWLKKHTDLYGDLRNAVNMALSGDMDESILRFVRAYTIKQHDD